MRITILIPHYRTGKMTAYAIAQFLKYKGDHEVDILVVDNKPDGSIRYLAPFGDQIKRFIYPVGLLQSHGIGFDYLLPHIETEYFITAESDSFPTQDNWLDYYADLIENGYDSAGSLLQLSGGQFIHPAGAMYKKSIVLEAQKYCNNINYGYFPNMAKKEGFDCHLMVRKDIMMEFLKSPEPQIELAENYKNNYSAAAALDKLIYYKPVVGAFHNGMGRLQESVTTYGRRNIIEDSAALLLNDSAELIYRIGYEPGQWLCYWQMATDRMIHTIPTEVKWLPGRENQQQEYTIMENGFKHLWGISAYHDGGGADSQDIAAVKMQTPNELYETLPENLKINNK